MITIPVMIAFWLSTTLLLYFVVFPFAQGYGVDDGPFEVAFAPFFLSDEAGRFFITLCWPLWTPVSVIMSISILVEILAQKVSKHFPKVSKASIPNYFREKGKKTRKKNND